MFDFAKMHSDLKKKVNHTIKNNKHISKVTSTYKNQKGKFGCLPGDKKCQQKVKEEKEKKLKEKHDLIIKRNEELSKPYSYNSAIHNKYHTGVYNRVTGSNCNNKLNGVSLISKYHMAQKKTEPILHEGKSKHVHIPGHHIQCQNSCSETFSNYTNNIENFSNIYESNRNNKIVDIILLILLILCVIFYLYFHIKQFSCKRKKKY